MRTPLVSLARSARQVASRVSLPVVGVLCLAAGRAQAQTVTPLNTTPVFSEDFSTSTLNRMNWNATDKYQGLQRTRWGKTPTFGKDADGTTYARLGIDSYNPDPEDKGINFLGTQLTSVSRFNVGAGVEFEVRYRAKNLPPGLVIGVFPYGDAGVYKDTYQKSEVDFEFLTKQEDIYVWTNVWDDWNPLRSGDLHSMSGWAETPHWNNGTWNTFKVRWYPDRTEWIANNKIIRTESRVVAGSPMGIWLNLWAANEYWEPAYDAALKAATTAGTNKSYYYDVDYVRVRPIPKTASQGVIGTGTGLDGAYYDTVDFKNLKFNRLDPRVNFDWGTFGPDSNMGTDTYSVRWTGSIQAPFTQAYTFTLTSADGARVWVNNKLIIDSWGDRTTPYTKTGKIALTAGAKVPIRVDYYNKTGAANIQLYWQSNSTPKQLVPQSQLYVSGQPAAPTFAPGPRTYTTAQNVAITSSTPGTTIRYTLDGSTPTESSAVLASGATLRLGTNTVLRARAFLPGKVPSVTRTGEYLFSFKDTTPPAVAITSPAANASAKAITSVSGTVSDSQSGVSRVDLVITRLSDGLCWTGTTWINQQYGLKGVINGSNWSVTSGFPTGSNLPVGQYELKAVAYDLAGNVAGKAQKINIVSAAAISAIQVPTPTPTAAPSEEAPSTTDATSEKAPSAGNF